MHCMNWVENKMKNRNKDSKKQQLTKENKCTRKKCTENVCFFFAIINEKNAIAITYQNCDDPNVNVNNS